MFNVEQDALGYMVVEHCSYFFLSLKFSLGDHRQGVGVGSPEKGWGQLKSIGTREGVEEVRCVFRQQTGDMRTEDTHGRRGSFVDARSRAVHLCRPLLQLQLLFHRQANQHQHWPLRTRSSVEKAKKTRKIIFWAARHQSFLKGKPLQENTNCHLNQKPSVYKPSPWRP